MPEVAKHDADLAGGAKEEVFSSDGGAVEPISFPVATENDDVDASNTMSAEQAFEVFAGKVFQANPYEKKTTPEPSNESPLEKLGRLKRELTELQEECAESTVLQEPLAQLQADLQQTSEILVQKQETLTASIQASVTGLQGAGTSGAASNTVMQPSTPSSRTPQLLERLARLEQHVSGTNICDRVASLEQLPALKIEQLQKQSKVIRQDLEAASKARHKLTAGSSGSSADDSKKICALYDELQSLQGLSQHLPAVVQRLQALAGTHADAASLQARFSAVEQITGNLTTQATSIETAVAALDATLQQNAASMQESIGALEERMKAL